MFWGQVALKIHMFNNSEGSRVSLSGHGPSGCVRRWVTESFWVERFMWVVKWTVHLCLQCVFRVTERVSLTQALSPAAIVTLSCLLPAPSYSDSLSFAQMNR